MSFILDALKKSESDRQRQGGPALFEVKVAAPRSALPLWAIAIAVLFAANLGVVLYLLLRHTGAPAPAATPTAAAAAPAGGSRAPAAPAAAASPPAAAVAASPPAQEPAAGAPTDESSAVAEKRRARLAAEEREDAAGIAAAPSRNGAGPSLNPDDYAPAAEAPPRSGAASGAAAAAGDSGSVKSGTEAGVPLYQQLATDPGSQLPQLRLDLHAYAERPTDRWVLINMHKLHEGDSLPEGVHVDRITPSGAVLSFRGSQFLLTQ
jgi:general secretion pathway protein B